MSVLQTVNFVADSIKMRWKEPYVTAGLNQKTLAVLPKGVFTGFTPVSTGISWGLTLNVDSVLGFSGANILETTLNKFCVTLIQSTNISLDLTAQAGTTVFITLDAQYAIGSTTAAQVKVVDLAELSLNSDLILLAKVSVPGVAPILASHINTAYRSNAGDALTVESRPTYNLLPNGDFERDTLGGVPNGWSASSANLTNGASFTVVAGTFPGAFPRFHSGLQGLQVSPLAAAVDSITTIPLRVAPGRAYVATAWLRGLVAVPVTGGTGVHVQVQWFAFSGSLLSTTDIEAPYTVSTTTWEVRSQEVIAPAGAANAKFRILWDNCTGWIYADDVSLTARVLDSLAGGAAIDEPFAVYGAPAGLVNAKRLDYAASSGAVGGQPWTFRAGDVSTVAAVTQGFTGSTQDLHQFQDSAGTTLFKVKSDGTLGFSTDWTLYRQASSQIRLRNVDAFTADRHFKFSTFTSPAGTDGKTNFELIGSSVFDSGHERFKIQLGSFGFAGARIGSEDDIGIRIRQNATDGWLFSNSFNSYDLTAASGATLSGIRASTARYLSNEAARLGTVQAARPNLLVNGDMAINQRRVISGTLGPGIRAYVADRWYAFAGATGGTSASYAWFATGGPSGFPSGMTVGRTSGNSGTAFRGLIQEIDRDLWKAAYDSSGNVPLALSFWAKAGATFSSAGGVLDVRMLSGFPTNIYENARTGYTGGTSNNFPNPFVSTVLTTSWQQFFLGWGSVGGYVAALEFIYFPTGGPAAVTDAFSITGVHLVPCNGSGGADLRGLPFSLSSGSPGGEMRACEKYYEKSYDKDVALQSFPDFKGAHTSIMSAAGAWVPGVQFRTRKVVPWNTGYSGGTVAFSPDSGGVGLAYTGFSAGTGADKGCDTTTPNGEATQNFETTAPAAATGNLGVFQWSADYEI